MSKLFSIPDYAIYRDQSRPKKLSNTSYTVRSAENHDVTKSDYSTEESGPVGAK